MDRDALRKSWIDFIERKLATDGKVSVAELAASCDIQPERLKEYIKKEILDRGYLKDVCLDGPVIQVIQKKAKTESKIRVKIALVAFASVILLLGGTILYFWEETYTWISPWHVPRTRTYAVKLVENETLENYELAEYGSGWAAWESNSFAAEAGDWILISYSIPNEVEIKIRNGPEIVWGVRSYVGSIQHTENILLRYSGSTFVTLLNYNTFPANVSISFSAGGNRKETYYEPVLLPKAGRRKPYEAAGIALVFTGILVIASAVLVRMAPRWMETR